MRSRAAVFLPTPGTRRSASASSAGDHPAKVKRRVHGHDRQRECRADTVRTEQRLEARPARRRAEAVQGVGVFPDVVVDVEERLGADVEGWRGCGA